MTMILGFPSNVFIDKQKKVDFIVELKKFGISFVESELPYVISKTVVPVATSIVVRTLINIGL